jgi:hypothetical protein
LAADGAAGIPFAEYDRLVKAVALNHEVWIDSEGKEVRPTAVEIEIALDILSRGAI